MNELLMYEIHVLEKILISTMYHVSIMFLIIKQK
jgi:hypothetical protein